MLLALDTSTERMGLALYDGHEILSEVVWRTGRHHTQALAPWVHKLLTAHGLTMRDVQAVAVATGPGSFTGLRVGIAFAKALALAAHVQVVGVFSLDIAAAAVPEVPGHMLLALLPMGRRRLAAGWYRWRRDHWHAEGPPFLVVPEALPQKITEPTLITGEFSSDVARVLERHPKVRLVPAALRVRRPAWLAHIAWERWQKGLVDDPVTLTPYYLGGSAPATVGFPGT